MLHSNVHLMRRYSHYSSVDTVLTNDRTLGVQRQVNISKVLERKIDDRTLVSVRSTPTALSDSSEHCGREELTGASGQEDLRVRSLWQYCLI
jgi:hypothetical protein